MSIFELANEMILSVSNVLSTIPTNNNIFFLGQILLFLSFAFIRNLEQNFSGFQVGLPYLEKVL